MLVFTDNIKVLVIQSIIAGGFLCLVYDILRAIRRSFNILPSGDGMSRCRFVLCLIALGIMDFVFCIFSAICILLLSYCAGGGVFRGLQLVLMLLGFALVRVTVSRIFLTALCFVLGIVKRIFEFVFKVMAKIAKPIFYLYHLTLGRIIFIIRDRIKKDRKSIGDAEGGNDVIIGEVQKTEESHASQGRIFIGRRA